MVDGRGRWKYFSYFLFDFWRVIWFVFAFGGGGGELNGMIGLREWVGGEWMVGERVDG